MAYHFCLYAGNKLYEFKKTDAKIDFEMLLD